MKKRKDELSPGMVLGEKIEDPSCNLELPSGTILNSRIISDCKPLLGDHVTILEDPSIQNLVGLTNSALESNLLRLVIPAGNYLYLQGEIGQKVFLLVKGKLELIYIDPEKLASLDERKEKVSVIATEGRRVSSITKPNSIFGELAPLLALPRMVSVLAVEHTIVAIIPAGTNELHQTILNHPNFGLSMATGLANQVSERIQTIGECKELLDKIDPLLVEFPTAYLNFTKAIKNRLIYSPNQTLHLAHNRMEASEIYSKVRSFQIDSSALKNYHPIAGHCYRNINYEIFRDSEVIEVPEGTVICAPGDPSDTIYILRSGALGVLSENNSVINYRRKGDALGTVAALLSASSKNQDFSRRTFTIKALSPTRYIQIKASEFNTLSVSNPELVLHISRGLADRVRNTNAELLATLVKMEIYFKQLHDGEETIISEIKTALNLGYSDTILRELCVEDIKVLENMQKILEEIGNSVQEILSSTHPRATFQPV